jgi:hypothetical protein
VSWSRSWPRHSGYEANTGRSALLVKLRMRASYSRRRLSGSSSSAIVGRFASRMVASMNEQGAYLMVGPCDLTAAGREALERDRRLRPRLLPAS